MVESIGRIGVKEPSKVSELMEKAQLSRRNLIVGGGAAAAIAGTACQALLVVAQAA